MLNTTTRARLTARLLRRGFVFFVVVNWNRIQIFGLKNLAAAQATDVFSAVAPVQEFGPLMLAFLHNEVKPILDCTMWVSSVKLPMRFRRLHRVQSSQTRRGLALAADGGEPMRRLAVPPA
jgi:hypothetical protein